MCSRKSPRDAAPNASQLGSSRSPRLLAAPLHSAGASRRSEPPVTSCSMGSPQAPLPSPPSMVPDLLTRAGWRPRASPPIPPTPLRSSSSSSVMVGLPVSARRLRDPRDPVSLLPFWRTAEAIFVASFRRPARPSHWGPCTLRIHRVRPPVHVQLGSRPTRGFLCSRSSQRAPEPRGPSGGGRTPCWDRSAPAE